MLIKLRSTNISNFQFKQIQVSSGLNLTNQKIQKKTELWWLRGLIEQSTALTPFWRCAVQIQAAPYHVHVHIWWWRFEQQRICCICCIYDKRIESLFVYVWYIWYIWFHSGSKQVQYLCTCRGNKYPRTHQEYKLATRGGSTSPCGCLATTIILQWEQGNLSCGRSSYPPPPCIEMVVNAGIGIKVTLATNFKVGIIRPDMSIFQKSCSPE